MAQIRPSECTATQPRDRLTVDQLRDEELPPFLDTSFFARPDWAEGDPDPFREVLADLVGLPEPMVA